MVLTLLITVFIILTTKVNCCFMYKVGDDRTNLEEARNICEGEGEGGRLIRVEDLADPGLKNLRTLQDLPTNSCVWIDGNVTYSPFVYWEGCYDRSTSLNVQDYISSRNKNATNIYQCTKFCQGQMKHSHIGLGIDTCYCFHNLSQFNLLLNSSTCNASCHQSAFIGESCGSMSTIDVYGILSSVDIQENAHELLPYVQCVFTKCDQPHCNYTVTSCDNKTFSKGYFCEGNSSVYNPYQCNTNICKDIVIWCTILKEYNWTRAWLECRQYGGRLVGQPENLFNDSVFPNSCFKCKPNYNDAYWTGIFRTVYFTSDNEGSRCLRVRNKTIEHVLVDNSTLTYYICKNESDNNQTTASTFTDRPEPPTDSVYTFNLWIFLAVVIGSSLVLIIVPATCFVLCRNSKRRTQSPSDAVIVYSNVEENVWAGTDGNGGNMDDTDSVYDIANHDQRNVHLQTTEFDTYSHLAVKDGAIGHPGDIYNHIKPNQNDRYNTGIYGNIDYTTEEHKELGIGQ